MRSYSILFFQCVLCLTFPFQPWTFGFAVCRANCFLMEVRISCWCLRSYTLSYFFGGWFPPSLEGGCSGVHKHSMVAFPHIYPLICKYLEGGSGGLHEHSLPASSWQDSRSQCSLVRPQKGFTFFSFSSFSFNDSGTRGNNQDQVSAGFPLDISHHALRSHNHWTGQIIFSYLQSALGNHSNNLNFHLYWYLSGGGVAISQTLFLPGAFSFFHQPFSLWFDPLKLLKTFPRWCPSWRVTMEESHR